ncbi:TPM domain-containing protein [Anaerocolumna sp. MB42-C2]|uniref:TPM domain-containing protein n=1 Tax=Anaerocolumna sp. MB42-C2 TaxID=3070997 RepID=UPI0027E204F4|nr:TPM domain-containing protein [Anaerocolumna sp. MB42-C2]WMJ90387.1 TPM domain-containing protein [Anaerocolumna sp. MB42-C2]
MINVQKHIPGKGVKPINRTIAFLILFLILFPVSTMFNPVKPLAAAKDQKVYDYNGLFNEEQVADLESICSDYGEDGKVDIVVITDDLGGDSPKTYLEDFYDEHKFGYNQEFGDTAMILVNMYSEDRSVTIQGYGDAEYYLNNDRIEHILDDVRPKLTDGDYYGAMEEFAKQAAYYMNEEKGVDTTPATGDAGSENYYGESGYNGPSDYYGEKEDNIFYNTGFQLLMAVIIGAVTVGIMAANSGGRVTVSDSTYLDEQNSGIVARRDDYIRTTTTRVKKPSNNQSGGRSSGGGGISSGGHSHSGGSRGF